MSTALVANKRHRMNAVTLLFARVDRENLCLREDTWTALMWGREAKSVVLVAWFCGVSCGPRQMATSHGMFGGGKKLIQHH